MIMRGAGRVAALAVQVCCILAATGCPSRSSSSGRKAGARPIPKVHTDIAGLDKHIVLPPGVTSARWVMQPPGFSARWPHDVDLMAYVEVRPEAWSALAGAIKPSSGQEVWLDSLVALGVLPPNVVGTDASSIHVSGTQYDLAKWSDGGIGNELGIRVGDGLVLMSRWTSETEEEDEE